LTDAAPATPLTWLPETPSAEPPRQLMLLLHGVGSSGAAMAPLARALRQAFPQAVLVAPDAPQAFDLGPQGRQWFSVAGITDDNREARVEQALPGFVALVRQLQQQHGVGEDGTALVGFSQGAILSLEASVRHDGLAGRVLAFAGRYARLPMHAPQATTLHLLHGEADAVIPVQHARSAIERLAARQGDATLDIASGVGHELAPALVQRAVWRLQNHIPHRTWAQALGAVPPHIARRMQEQSGQTDTDSND
jgi:phospholipase/carboxylesterase